MAGKKKFGAFAGVFTPSILTILGVIMYMRLGWVVGNAGLIGAIAIILIAHVIAVTTGLSVSSVATDKKIGAGGIYYVLSRSMGIPIGGAIGIALYVGTAFSIALYLIGFAESFNEFFGFGSTVNDYRITGTLALVSLSALALISTSAALKAQFFILAAIIISLISVFLGSMEFAPEAINLTAPKDAMSMSVVFAIFFPAVTGFTAGIAMSGDLKAPKKSIPIGTLLAIGTGLIVYVGLAIFLAYAVNSNELQNNNNILREIALWPMAVVGGIWGATLSSALGGILGGPRILQAMSLDGVTPKFFGKGQGKDNEPVNALLLVFLIAEVGILIGELDVIAGIVSMFFLATYAFINISFFLEKWANPDFQPTFKISKWIGLVGFIACVGIMMFTDWVNMIAALGVISGLYFFLTKKQISIGSNDVWKSVWGNVVNTGLRKLEETKEGSTSWSPNVMLFTGENRNTRLHLLEFSKTISGRSGIVTDFNLYSNKNNENTLPKQKQNYKDDLLEKFGVFGKKIEVEDYYTGIENIASTYGFSGVEPNTVMLNWTKYSKNPTKSARMIKKLIHLDYNLLYLDYDKKTKFGTKQTIDVWWRETDGHNAELMLNIARYILQSPDWVNVKIRVLFVNHNNADNTIVKLKISKLLEQLRINADIKIINNGVEQKSFYEIIELQSAKTDLILLGIPNFDAQKQADYILNTDQLFETVGTTLLVRASNNFNELDLEFAKNKHLSSKINREEAPLKKSDIEAIDNAIIEWDTNLRETSKTLSNPALNSLSSNYFKFIKQVQKEFETTINGLNENHSISKVIIDLQLFLTKTSALSYPLINDKLVETETLFKNALKEIDNDRKKHLSTVPNKLSYTLNGKKMKLPWYSILKSKYDTIILPNYKNALYNLGIQNFMLVNGLSESLNEEALVFVEKLSKGEDNVLVFDGFRNNIQTLIDESLSRCIAMETEVIEIMNATEREVCNSISLNFSNKKVIDNIKKNKVKRKSIEKIEEEVLLFSENWFRNQVLAHNQFVSNLSLGKTKLATFGVNELIKKKIKRLAFKTQKSDITLFKEVLDYVITNFEKEDLTAYKNKTLDKLAEEVLLVDLNHELKSERDRITSISNTPEFVKLMTSESFNELQNYQNEDVKDADISLANIERFILKSTYLDPLQDSIDVLELASKEMSEELYNFSNLVKYIISEPLTEENKEEFKKNLLNAKAKLSDCSNNLIKEENSFVFSLNTHINSTIIDLDTRHILESIESYSKVSLRAIHKSKFQLWREEKNKAFYKKYKEVTRFISQKKRDVDTLKFIKEHKHFLSNIELTNNFVNSLNFNDGVDHELSYYYQRLFTGSHLGKVNPKYRSSALKSAQNAINRIDSGISGGIMILGESSVGKTFFMESITETMLKAKKVYLTPPKNQKYKAKDIHLAFQQAYNKKGTAESIINQINQKTVFVIEDLEQWWFKLEGGQEAIDYIADLIEKFGAKHYFIITCNMFSYEIIRQVSNIEKELLTSIIIAPATRSELKSIIMNRHKTANATIWYKDSLIEKAKRTDALFNEIYSKSEGNIGVALGIWKSYIKKDDDNNLYLTRTEYSYFPHTNNPKWKALLYAFIMHGSLSNNQLLIIFNHETWVSSSLKELEKTSLISKNIEGKYKIKPSLKHYIEEWMKELTILN